MHYASRSASEDSGIFESILENRFFHSGEHKSDIRCIGSLCETLEVSFGTVIPCKVTHCGYRLR